jgi:APA family basic amino acid/polyamine antiporter
MELQRKLTLLDLIMVGVGSIIGSGIFILFASILSRSRQFIFWAFLLAAIPNILCALAYAEIASMFQQNDAEYDSIREALGEPTAKATIYLLLCFIIFNTATILLFIGHLLDFEYVKLLLCGLLIILSVINYYGITLSKGIINTVGFIEISVLILVALLSSPHWKIKNITTLPPITNNSFLFASFMSLFLYSGYDAIIKMSEETIYPKYDVSYGILGSIITVTIIYLLLGLTASSSGNLASIYNSKTPITGLFSEFINKDSAFMITALGLIILMNTLFISMISLSRFIYSLSKEQLLPSYLNKLDDTYKTPYNAIITVFVILTVIALIFTGEKCAMFTNFFFLTFTIFLMISVIILRIYHPDMERPFMIPLNIENVPIPMIFGIMLSIFYLFVGICNYHEAQ